MRRALTLSATAVLILSLAALGDQATAAPIMPTGLSSTPEPIINVRWRGHGRHMWNHGWRHRHRYGWGPAIGGFAAGAAIGGAIANSRAQARENDSYCMQRFRSYDPQSGTYLGYDGQRHPCP